MPVEFFNPFDNGPAVTTGCYVGTVISAQGTVDSEGLAFTEDITYTVIWSDMGGIRQQEGVIPRHRRPIIAPGKIIPAQPGDRCIVQVAAGIAYFIIFEGLAPGVCE